MRKLLLAVVAVAVVGATFGIAESKKKKPVEKPGLLKQLHDAAGCPSEDAPHRIWCIAADGFAAVALVFKGKAEQAELPKDLLDYVSGLPKSASYPVEKGQTGWTLKGASTAELRQVGEFWVAVETPSQGPEGIFVSIFTDRVAAKK